MITSDTYTVADFVPPQPRPGVQYWERTRDPYHPAAYDSLLGGILKESLWCQLFRPARKSGWGGIDYSENLVAFVPDGSVEDGSVPEYFLRKGPYGHFCAYDTDDFDRIRTHESWMAAARK